MPLCTAWTHRSVGTFGVMKVTVPMDSISNPTTMLRSASMGRDRRLARAGRRGAVMVEYTLLLTTVGIMFITGLTAAGRVMLTQYQEGRSWILLPVP